MKPERRDFLKLTAGAVAGGLAGTGSTEAASERIDLTAVSALQREVKGSVVARGSPVYEAWRQSMIWNYRKFARYPDVIVQAEKFTSTAKGSMSGLSGLTTGMSKLKAGAFVAKSTPSYSKNLFDVFRKTMTISQNNGVKVPADATQALGGLE